MTRKIINYPANILKTYNTNSKNNFASQAISNKYYAGLKHLITSLNEDWKAIEAKINEQNELLSKAAELKSKNDYLLNMTNTT